MKVRGAVLLTAVFLAAGDRALAGSCAVLQYGFEPDCFVRGTDGHCRFDPDRPDLGPQVAVWVESAGGEFVETLYVTNAVGLYGIGNRPGRSDVRSGPRFPYGRRVMALPVWAHRRGKSYPAVVSKDGREDSLTGHERVSSPEPYFCRPMLQTEVLDAVTCASGRFRSDKGIWDPTGGTSLYPPRGDLLDWASSCVPVINNNGAACDPGDAADFEGVNDLDAVSGPTPSYDRIFNAHWQLPPGLNDGDYRLLVEVSKELDQDAAFSPPSYLSADDQTFYEAYGWSNNLGQPSVVFAVPFSVTGGALGVIGEERRLGAGDATGTSGALVELAAGAPGLAENGGSGWGRLRSLPAAPGESARHVSVEAVPCLPLDCSTAHPVEPPRLLDKEVLATSSTATVAFLPSRDEDAAALDYDVRGRLANGPYFQADDVAHWPTLATLAPPVTSDPATPLTVTLEGLTPQSSYALAVRARGRCGWSAPSLVRVETKAIAYRRLSGCVIATAAFGSPDEPQVATMRRVRDAWARRSAWGLLLAELYAESAPPVAQALARSDSLRAWMREGLGAAFALATLASRSQR